MKIVVGLGNPGEKYLGSRHNFGFGILDAYVAKQLSVKNSEKFWREEKKFKAEIGELEIEGEKTLLVKPLTFMNNSGLAVKLVTTYYKLPTTNLIVIHDDLDLMLGKIKVRIGGAAGGHHGVESVIKELGTDQFIRLKVGIGNDKSHSGERNRVSFIAEKFVLDQFASSEKPKVKHVIKQTLEALNTLLKEGIDVAQNQFN